MMSLHIFWSEALVEAVLAFVMLMLAGLAFVGANITAITEHCCINRSIEKIICYFIIICGENV
jgi:hypothetical protein